MPRGTHMRQKRKAFSTKLLNDIFIQANREVMQEMVDAWADGFNKIVKSWDDAPHFTGKVVYRKETARFFMYVEITGTDDARKHFKWVDQGLARKKKIEIIGPRGGKKMVPNEVKVKGVNYPALTTFVRYPRGVPRRREEKYKDGKLAGRESKRSYAAYLKKVEKQYTRAMSPMQQARSRGDFGKKMPIRQHDAKTGKGGKFKGSGKYYPAKGASRSQWKGIPMLHTVVLGDIEARNFTTGLFFMTHLGRDTYRMRHIWPGMRTFKKWTKRGYDRGRYRNAKSTKS